MLVHTPEQINQLSEIARARGIQTYDLGERSVSFAVAHINPAPFPLAVAAAFPAINPDGGLKDQAQTGIVIVSDDVPRGLRGLWALHERIDFEELGHDTPRRCYQADTTILEELGKHNPQLGRDYSEKRIDFYKDLAKYMLNETRRKISSLQESPYQLYDIAGCYAALKLHKKRLSV